MRAAAEVAVGRTHFGTCPSQTAWRTRYEGEWGWRGGVSVVRPARTCIAVPCCVQNSAARKSGYLTLLKAIRDGGALDEEVVRLGEARVGSRPAGLAHPSPPLFPRSRQMTRSHRVVRTGEGAERELRHAGGCGGGAGGVGADARRPQDKGATGYQCALVASLASSLLPLCAHANANAQVKGTAATLLPLLVSRGLAANKSATFTVAVDSAVLLCALDGVSPPTVAALVAGLKNGKVKKGQTGCARIIAAIVSCVGPTARPTGTVRRTFTPSPATVQLPAHAKAFKPDWAGLVACLPPLLQAGERAQRDAAVALTAEMALHDPTAVADLVRRFGAAIAPDVVAAVLPQGVEAALAGITAKGVAAPGSAAAVATAAAGGAGGAAASSVPASLEAREEAGDAEYASATAVDIGREVERVNLAKAMGEKAWAERVKALEAIADVASKHPK